MSTRQSVTEHQVSELARLERGLAISNRSARALAQLGWVQVRVTKVYGDNPHKIRKVWITPAGRNALSSVRIALGREPERDRVTDPFLDGGK
jgi:hypothetical protein